LPLPAVHPAKPAGPPPYTPTFPNTAGYNAVTISNSCSGTGVNNELQVAITNAVALQHINGTVITIPAGTVCAGNFFFPEDTNAAIQNFTSSDVSGNTITITGHGYHNGQAVMVTDSSLSGGFPVETGVGYQGHMPSPLVIGEIYYIINATANTFQLSLTPTG